MSKELEKARDYERKEALKIKEEERPVFHVSSFVGWMNDPNGFSMFQGEYHLFYQYHPYSTVWGPMHWGHCKTKDFIKWDYLPAALAPDKEYDKAGCFSGSAIEWNGNQYLIYTGVKEVFEKETKHVVQTQCIAIGDGVHFEKYPGNPVILGDLLPEGCSREDFRDPKIWKEGNRLFCVMGNHQQKDGQVVLFTSENGFDWNFVTILDKSEHKVGFMWECPDFFCIGEDAVILISPMGMKAEGLEYHNGNGTVYFIGNYDKKEKKFERKIQKALDYGLDFYAPQSMETADGRRILIGWMHNWDNCNYPDNFLWRGMMSIPRELTIENGFLMQKPVRELENYYKNTIQKETILCNEEKEWKEISGRAFSLELQISGNYEAFSIYMAEDKEKEQYLILTYYPHSHILRFDRSYSGVTKDTLHMRELQIRNITDNLHLQILLDKYSAEIFINGGEQVMTSTYFTDLKAKGIHFASKGKAKVSLCYHNIE